MEFLANLVADVECLSRLPGKEEGFDLPLRLSSSLSQLLMSAGKETNMKHFFKGQAYPSHEFILSSGFSRKKGAKVQPFSLFKARVHPVLWCRVSHFQYTKWVAKYQNRDTA